MASTKSRPRGLGRDYPAAPERRKVRLILGWGVYTFEAGNLV